jgi:hypothetical protein
MIDTGNEIKWTLIRLDQLAGWCPRSSSGAVVWTTFFYSITQFERAYDGTSPYAMLNGYLIKLSQIA